MAKTRSRNGRSPKGPQTGERGVAATSESLGGAPGLRYGQKRRQPTVPELDYMILVDGWSAAIDGAQTWPIRTLEWKVEEADGDRGEADLVREQLRPLMDKLVAGMCSAIGRRVAYFEQVWEDDGIQTVLKDIVLRPADKCEMLRDKNGRPKGFKQRGYAPGRGLFAEEFLISDRKAFVFLNDNASRPGVGVSSLGPAWHNFEDKQRLDFYRMKLLEKYGGPSTHGKTGAAAGSDARRSFETAVKDARSGASITTGLEEEINYLAPPNAGGQFREARQDGNFESAISAFVQHLGLSQEGNSGAYALSRDHSDFFTIISDGRVAEQDAAVSDGPIADIVFWNFGPNAAIPSLKRESLSEHITKRVLDAAKYYFTHGGQVPPWAGEGLIDAWAAALGIEKPEGAESLPETPLDTPATSDSGEGGP